MTVAEYLDWAMAQPRGRYELVDGKVIAMSPERARHVRAKMSVATALQNSIDRGKLPCESFVDGMTVVIDENTAREPDALVQCGKPIDPDSLIADNPVIVVEVLSPSSERADTSEKLAEYFSVGSIRHYLIVNPFRRLVIRHSMSESGEIETRIVESGELDLSPPGLALSVDELLGPVRA